MGSEGDAEAVTADVEVDRPGVAAQLTDRDRDVLGLLVLGRYLTAAQVHRLAFDGRNLSVAYRRLLKLSRAGGGQPAFVRQRFFRTYDGTRVAVWAPAPHGMPAALARAGTLPDLPKHDVGAHFLEHLIRLNDVFVDLWRTGGRCPRATHPALRWIPSDRVRLQWGEWEIRQGRRQQRVIQPDAVLELVAQRRRLFLECEMGTHVISPGTPNSPGATLAKAARYRAFLDGLTGGEGGGTHYDAQYRDGFAREVLYLVQTPGRAASVNAALAKWRRELGGQVSRQRAETFEAATAELRQAAGLPALVPVAVKGAHARAERPIGAAALSTFDDGGSGARGTAAKPAREVTSSEVRLLERFYDESLTALKRVRDLFRNELKRADIPRYPESAEGVQAVLARWAHR